MLWGILAVLVGFGVMKLYGEWKLNKLEKEMRVKNGRNKTRR